ncbi:MFS transporter [Actinomadura litoris]|uniref:MFS transporter n=1 Tax=Actinomadura litoris TaxID=2678616 RepID=A0A7K1KYP7_9ACTN|nr:MFS transporter [Actinomadura litoris]MUN37331.1 MFS transporter [Actinomadura litoris]
MRVRGFFGVWLTAAGGNLGDGLALAVFPLLATRLTDAPALVAGATLARTLPYAAAPLVAGALVDRTNRRLLILGANLARGAAALALCAALLTDLGSLGALYAAAFLIGLGETFADIGTSALVPAVVGRDRLDQANSWLQGTESTLNEFVGPPIGGALILGGTALAAGGIAGAYLLAAAGMLLLRGAYRPARSAPATVRADIADGLRFLWNHRVMRTLALMVTVMAACWSAWMAVLVLYVVAPGPVGLNSVGYGALLSALAVGGVAGSFLTVLVRRGLGLRWVLGGDVVTSVVLLGAPALTADPWIIGCATFVGGLGSGMWNVTVRTLRQRLTPDELLGRVGGASRTLGWGAVPLGAALAGLVAETTGPRLVFALAAAGTALMIVPVFRVLTPSALADHEPAPRPTAAVD